MLAQYGELPLAVLGREIVFHDGTVGRLREPLKLAVREQRDTQRRGTQRCANGRGPALQGAILKR